MANEAARRLMARLDEFGGFTDEPGKLTRLYLSPAYARACERFVEWAREAGLAAYIDAVGNVRARYEGRRPNAPALMIGSHIDTVRDAGRYDGNLGALAALSIVEMLIERRERLDFAIEIAAFGDEEGVRFPTTMTGSRAVAGVLDPTAFAAKDREGVKLGDALTAFGGSPLAWREAEARDVAAFVELHIEQGPVLEREGLAVGTVTAINGATRLEILVTGHAGHAGSVPMPLRRDALTAAAEMILAIEARAARAPDLVATVGQMEARPGAVNVIPGAARFSIDIRSPSEPRRKTAVADIVASLREIAERRKVEIAVRATHEAPAFVCDPRIVAGFDAAAQAVGEPVFHLPSGAGHDSMILGRRWPAGMLFVRCQGGISHNPLESITTADCDTALAVLFAFVKDFRLA